MKCLEKLVINLERNEAFRLLDFCSQNSTILSDLTLIQPEMDNRTVDALSRMTKLTISQQYLGRNVWWQNIKNAISKLPNLQTLTLHDVSVNRATVLLDLEVMTSIEIIHLNHVSKTPITETLLLTINEILKKNNRMVTIRITDDPNEKLNIPLETTVNTKNITLLTEYTYGSNLPFRNRELL